jgi:hypothetical protein
MPCGMIAIAAQPALGAGEGTLQHSSGSGMSPEQVGEPPAQLVRRAARRSAPEDV